MGTTISIQTEEKSKVLFFLHRTWAVIVTRRKKTPTGSLSDYQSQYSYCSCSQCRDDGFDSGSISDIFNESTSQTSQNDFAEEFTKEKQRPPIYNPEDYCLMLRKWGKKSSNTSLYSSSSTSDLDSTRSQGNSFRDYRNPMLTSSGSEMTLRQFGTVSELLGKLKTDLKLAFPSFAQEFVAEPLDGVTLLLDLLRAIQLSQSNNVHGNTGSTSTTGKIPASLQRRALLDELSCLQCLLNCCMRYSESLTKLISSSGGLFTIAVCIMSNVNKSRIIALQLLAKCCTPSIAGHSAVSEAMSTLRLRFGEPVRFRFLVGMMTSTGGQQELISAGMHFLNCFLNSAATSQKRLYIQAELDQAGFDLDIIKKNIPGNAEILTWERYYLNVENLSRNLENSKRENSVLKERVNKLERKIKALQDDKSLLSDVEKSLKDRCSELQLEIRSLKGSYTKKHIMTNEDEGISSSERSITPDEVFYPEAKQEDEETTIDDVIEELKNIINTETEEMKKVHQEHEIVPSGLQPQPPRRAKSLVQLFVPSEDYYYCPKELFFENETPCTSTNGSDSLLSVKNKFLDSGFSSCQYTTTVNVSPTKCKSLERIDNGLESMVDIVVTNNLEKSVSNIYIRDMTHYFPKIHEKKSSQSFLIKRGNAGLYSGLQQEKGNKYLSLSNSFLGKVTDLPSGLY